MDVKVDDLAFYRIALVVVAQNDYPFTPPHASPIEKDVPSDQIFTLNHTKWERCTATGNIQYSSHGGMPSIQLIAAMAVLLHHSPRINTREPTHENQHTGGRAETSLMETVEYGGHGR